MLLLLCYAGLQVFFSNGQVMTPKGNVVDGYVAVREFHLEDEEVITRVELRSGWCIGSMTFHTNKNRTLGPYSDGGGNYHSVDPPGFSQALAWISFNTAHSQSGLVITCLKFGFRYFEMPH